MPLEEKFPTMTDAELATLFGNVERLALAGTDRQKLEAGRLHPLITAELADRKAKLPPKKTARKAAAKR